MNAKAAQRNDINYVGSFSGAMAQSPSDASPAEMLEGDLATARLDERFDVVALAGNVLIFVAPGTEGEVIARCAEHLVDGGLLIAGFQVAPGGFGPDALDRAAADAGLALVDRWATWDRAPWMAGGDYQVSVHRRP